MSKIEAIIDDKYREQYVPTVKGLICEVHDSKKLGKMIIFLSENYPLTNYNLNHLKRIDSKSQNPKRIFVCPVPEEFLLNGNSTSEHVYDKAEVPVEQLKDDKLKQFLIDNQMSHLLSIDIPAKIPITKVQNVNALKLWPVNFHENQYLEKCLSGTVFNSKEASQIDELFDRISLKNHSETCSEMSVLITKNNRSIIVSKTTFLCDREDNCSQNPLDHPVLKAIEQVSEMHRIAKESKTNCAEELKHYQNDYLCTNYECFLTQDPCIMCAMALVHSRIKRVFISNENSFDGCFDKAFQTHRLHILPNLNHHFDVFIVFKKSEDSDDLPSKKIKLSTES